LDSRTGPSSAISIAGQQGPDRQRLYIFFTLWGLLFLLAGTMMFSYGLIRLNEDLLFYAAFTAGILLFIILMTHENLSGVSISKTVASVDPTSGALSLNVQLTNSSKSRRRNCRVTLLLDGKRTIPLGPVDIPALGQASLSHRFEQGMPRLATLMRTRVLSRYPFGLLTCWINVKAEPKWQLCLPPTPQRHPPAGRATRQLAPQSEESPEHSASGGKKNQTEGEMCLQNYTSGPVQRIDWRRYLATGALLTRAQEEPDPVPASSRLEWVWDAAADTSRLHYAQIYSSVLEALRTVRPYVISSPSGAEITRWDGLSASAGAALHDFLRHGPIP
jgi:hypothetical protein